MDNAVIVQISDPGDHTVQPKEEKIGRHPLGMFIDQLVE